VRWVAKLGKWFCQLLVSQSNYSTKHLRQLYFGGVGEDWGPGVLRTEVGS